MTDKIIESICNSYGITREELLSKSRKQEYVMARIMVGYILRRNTNLSLNAIAKKIKRNHSAIVYYCKSAETEMKYNKVFNRIALDIECEIAGGVFANDLEREYKEIRG